MLVAAEGWLVAAHASRARRGRGVGAASLLRHVGRCVESTAGTALVMGHVRTTVVSCILGRRLHRAGVNKVFVRLFLVLALHVVFLFVWPS